MAALQLYWNSLVTRFLATICPKGTNACIGVYKRNLISFRQNVFWMVSWSLLEVAYNTLLALAIGYGTALVSRNTIFWIGNTVDILCHDAVYFLPMFLNLPSRQPRPRPEQFYTRTPGLEPRRPERDLGRETVLPEISRTLPKIQAHLRIFPQDGTRSRTLPDVQTHSRTLLKVQTHSIQCSRALVEVTKN